MKVLHTADWHLGKKLDHFFSLGRAKEVIDEICDMRTARMQM
jgi:exonuclease SbcD